MKQAVLWDALDDKKVRCRLCHWGCVIAAGAAGRCRVRKNIDGVLYSLNADKVCAVSEDDPVEKKPLFHFLPGSRTFSISAPGCNFQCSFCQNWQISQSPYQNQIDGQSYSPQTIIAAAVRSGCRSIAYTYTEPTVFMELCAEVATLARQQGLYNIFVSNGFMSIDAIEFAKPWLDAINVDLKAFTKEFYRTLCKARLSPVLETICHIAKHTDIWMEITTLLIPGQNDSPEELKSLAEFIVKECGPDTPWHISRFYPQYRLTAKPPTSSAALQQAYDIGKQAGLRYVYVGNLPGNSAESTVCYACGKVLIERDGYRIIANRIRDCRCPYCRADIAGVGL